MLSPGKFKRFIILLFLDINTDTLSAWEFLERFERLEQPVRDRFSIYIISASVDPGDREKARANKYVKDCLVKPISAALLEQAFRTL